MPNIGKCLLAYAAAVLASVAIGAAELPKMIIATGVDPSFAHFYVGVSADILKKNGVDAQLMKKPVAQLTDEDIVALSAYLGSLVPQ